MDEALDDRLEREAAESGTSKAAIVRECVARRYADRDGVDDPIDDLIGSLHGDPVDDIDAVVYG